MGSHPQESEGHKGNFHDPVPPFLTHIGHGGWGLSRPQEAPFCPSTGLDFSVPPREEASFFWAEAALPRKAFRAASYANRRLLKIAQ